MLQLDTFFNGDRRAVVTKANQLIQYPQYTVICFDGEDFQEQQQFITHDLAKDFAEDWVNKW